MAFILGQSALGAASSTLGDVYENCDFTKYKVRIFDGTTWKTYKPIIVNSNTDTIQYCAYIGGSIESETVYAAGGTKVYHAINSPVYIKQ